MRKRYYILVPIICVLAILSVCLMVINAADLYRVNNGTAPMINEQGICKTVTNNSGKDIFVPTKTLTEWNSFIGHSPTGVALSSCASWKCPATGSTYADQATCNASCVQTAACSSPSSAISGSGLGFGSLVGSGNAIYDTNAGGGTTVDLTFPSGVSISGTIAYSTWQTYSGGGLGVGYHLIASGQYLYAYAYEPDTNQDGSYLGYLYFSGVTPYGDAYYFENYVGEDSLMPMTASVVNTGCQNWGYYGYCSASCPNNYTLCTIIFQTGCTTNWLYGNCSGPLQSYTPLYFVSSPVCPLSGGSACSGGNCTAPQTCVSN